MKKLLFFLICFLPFVSHAMVTREEYNKAVLETSISATTTYTQEFVYSFFFDGTKDNPINVKDKTVNKWLDRARKGYTSSGVTYGFKNDPGPQKNFKNKFAVYCGSFVNLMVYHASGGVLNMDAYEEIKPSEVQPGDLIHFDKPDTHIAVYVNDGNDNNPNTFTLAHATGGKAQLQFVTRTPDSALRIKSESLLKLDPNLINASYDFHDRLDDFAPIIVNIMQVGTEDKIRVVATDYKHYDLTPHDDLVEVENHGIDYYQVTTSSQTPTTGWNKVDRVDYFDKEITINDEGTLYVWVKDAGGNVAHKAIFIPKIERIINDKPVITASIPTNSFVKEIDININIKDEDGISSYSVSKTHGGVFNSVDNKKEFDYNYHVTENGVYYITAKDIYDNVTDYMIEVSNIDSDSPVIDDLYYEKNNIIVMAVDLKSGLDPFAYKLNDGDWVSNNTFFVDKNGIYEITVRDALGNSISKKITVSEIKDNNENNDKIITEKSNNNTIIIALIVVVAIIIIYMLFQMKKSNYKKRK